MSKGHNRQQFANLGDSYCCCDVHESRRITGQEIAPENNLILRLQARKHRSLAVSSMISLGKPGYNHKRVCQSMRSVSNNSQYPQGSRTTDAFVVYPFENN